VEELHRIEHPSADRKRFMEQYPNQPAYFFGLHDKYYTVSEMERIIKLKAFL
jgi:hypothetical protein